MKKNPYLKHRIITPYPMESSIITDVFLPVALAIIMLGMGLSLIPDDFRRVLVFPKAVLVGLLNQLILLPIIGFLIASNFGLGPEMAVGLMILAACPGGATSNLISHVSKGDTALSITLTALSSAVTIITVPLIINFSLEHFFGGTQAIQLPILKTIGSIFLIIIVPVSIGMLIRSRAPGFAKKMGKPVKITSIVFLALIIAGAILKEKEMLGDAFKQVGLATFALNAATMIVGFLTAKLFRLNLKQSITISIESGIQNGTFAILIAATLLKSSEMAIPPAIYSLIMFGTGGIMMYMFGRRKDGDEAKG